MNYEAFHNLWSGIESIATISGLLIAACWAGYTFYIRWHPALQITIKASQVQLPGDPNLYVSATVEIENKGTRIARLPYYSDETRQCKESFFVRRIVFQDD